MEKDEITEMLGNEIASLLEKLGELDPGTPEHESVTKDLERLYRLRTEEMKVIGEIENQREKIEVERISNENRINADIDYNTEKIMEDRRQHKVETIANAAETGVKILCAIGLGILGFMYEEHGSLRSPTRKVLADTFRPKL